jgi:hypothetical protein
MLFIDKLRSRALRQIDLPTRDELERVWDTFSAQWPEDNDRYDCWKPASVLPAPKGVVKLAIKRAYADWTGPVDWVVFSAFFIEFVDLATYLPQEKYDAIQAFRAGRFMQFGAESSHDPLLMFKLSSSLSPVSTPEICGQSIIDIRDRLRRSEAWNPVNASDDEVEHIRQILLESAVEYAALTAEWRLYILSIGRDKYDAAPSVTSVPRTEFLDTAPIETSAPTNDVQTLHRLWSIAVGTPSYDKTMWQQIEKQLLDGLSRDKA